jgi:hypothetical protein
MNLPVYYFFAGPDAVSVSAPGCAAMFRGLNRWARFPRRNTLAPEATARA